MRALLPARPCSPRLRVPGVCWRWSLPSPARGPRPPLELNAVQFPRKTSEGAWSGAPQGLPARQRQLQLASAPVRLRIGTRAMASDEQAAAKLAAQQVKDTGAPTIFDKIIQKQIPSTIVYEDDEALAFRDISPQAPVHILIIPKARAGLTQLSKADESHKPILGHLLYVSQLVAKQEGLAENGFRIVINDGADGCQSVYHLHLHLLGGRQMGWPPG